MSFTAGGRFAKIAGATEIQVNSLHGQGVDRPAPGLEVEGHAPDGTPEAVSVTGARRLALGVQWHPEYKPLQNDFSTRLFRAFSEARSEEHTSERQSLMRISYAVFCLKKQKTNIRTSSTYY